MATTEAPTPDYVEISPEDGSAYYLWTGDFEGKHVAELVQVPMNADGTVSWEDEGNGFWGGGAVDYYCGFENDADRDRIIAIENRLRTAAGEPPRSTN